MKDRESLTEQITDIVEDLVKKDTKEENLEKNINYYWIISEELLKSISMLKNKIEKSKEEDYGQSYITGFEEKNQSNLDDIEYLISSSEDSQITKFSHYSTMQHNYYKIRTAILDCKSIIFSRKMSVIDNKLKVIEEKSKTIEEKFEGIGSTILSTVVSLTVVITAITAINSIPPVYIPLYLISMVWLAMTLIVFINNLFNKKDFNSKQATFLYGIISLLVVIILFGTIFYIQRNDIDIFNYTLKKEQVLGET